MGATVNRCSNVLILLRFPCLSPSNILLDRLRNLLQLNRSRGGNARLVRRRPCPRGVPTAHTAHTHLCLSFERKVAQSARNRNRLYLRRVAISFAQRSTDGECQLAPICYWTDKLDHHFS